MKRWADLEAEAPQIAEGGRKLVYQYGVGLGFLATLRKDGGLRLHPFCPVITGGGIYGLIGPSPKRISSTHIPPRRSRSTTARAVSWPPSSAMSHSTPGA